MEAHELFAVDKRIGLNVYFQQGPHSTDREAPSLIRKRRKGSFQDNGVYAFSFCFLTIEGKVIVEVLIIELSFDRAK